MKLAFLFLCCLLAVFCYSPPFIIGQVGEGVPSLNGYVPVTVVDLLHPSLTQDLFIDFYNGHRGVIPIQTFNYTDGEFYNCNILILDSSTGNYTRWGHPTNNFVCTATAERVCVWTNDDIPDGTVKFAFYTSSVLWPNGITSTSLGNMIVISTYYPDYYQYALFRYVE